MADWPIGELRLAEPFPLTASDAVTEFAGLDSALQAKLEGANSAVVRCDFLLAGRASSFEIKERLEVAVTPVIHFQPRDSLGRAVIVLRDPNGVHAYVAAAPTAGTRWIEIPRLAEFYALAAIDKANQRQVWVQRLQAVRKADWPPDLASSFDKLRDLSAVALRLLLAWIAERATPVTGVEQPAQNFRGAQTHGTTSPVFLYPIVEPDCYLRVISGREGCLESINAYDLGAGISVGPIQFNAQDGAIFHLLRKLQLTDAALFEDCFSPLRWSTDEEGGSPVLVVSAGATEFRLIGRAADDNRNIGYLQSQEPGKSSFSDVDKSFRTKLANQLRNAVVWPHVQDFVLSESQAWLAPGLTKLNTAGFSPLDPLHPQRDLFILKALLLSAFVRYSGSLKPLIKHLEPFHTPAQKLQAIQPLLLEKAEWSELARKKRNALSERLKQQRPIAEAVYDSISRLANPTTVQEPIRAFDEIASHLSTTQRLLSDLTVLDRNGQRAMRDPLLHPTLLGGAANTIPLPANGLTVITQAVLSGFRRRRSEG